MEPDQYFKNQKIKESNTALGAFGRGAYQGATLELGDELEALLTSTFKNDATYQNELDRIRNQIDMYKETHPKSLMGGRITGGVGTALIPVGAGANIVAKGGSRLSQLARAGTLYSVEGAAIGGITAYNEARGSDKNADTFLRGSILGMLMAPVGGLAGKLSGSIVTPFVNQIYKTMGKTKGLAIVNDIRRYAREKSMTLNDAIKRMIIDDVPLIDVAPSVADLAKKVAMQHSTTAKNIVNANTKKNLLEQSGDLVNELQTSLVPERLIGTRNPYDYTNYLSKTDELIEQQYNKVNQNYKGSLDPAKVGNKAVPTVTLQKLYKGMLERNPQMISKVNTFLRNEFDTTLKNPITSKTIDGRTVVSFNHQPTLKEIESVNQYLKKLSFSKKDQFGQQTFREKNITPIRTEIDDNFPNVNLARSSKTALEEVKQSSQIMKGILGKQGSQVDEVFARYKKDLGQVSVPSDKRFVKEGYRVALAKEIQNAFQRAKNGNVAELNRLIRGLSDPENDINRIINEFYPEKSKIDLLEKTRKSANALLSRQNTEIGSTTAQNLKTLQATNAERGLNTLDALATQGSTLANVGLLGFRKLKNYLLDRNYSEVDAERIAQMITSQPSKFQGDLFRELVTNPQKIVQRNKDINRRTGLLGTINYETTREEDSPKMSDLSIMGQPIAPDRNAGIIDDLIKALR